MARRRRAPARKNGSSAMTLFIAIGGGALAAIVVAVVVIIARGGDGNDVPARRSTMSLSPVAVTGTQAEVEVYDDGFRPADIRITPGTTVTWRNTGDRPHDVTDDRGRFASKVLRNGDEFTFKFDAPGLYFYYCTIHHKMLGSVDVTN